ncbi:Zinc finger CCCH-type with G patch domain-containing protein [Trichoplax sp. H2]|nr:Zinc finger CCCH-type with G patch domain-containing protein [Trichoplax sp. H2]|eukprot:RDD46720.1 Zinc finger CCCH-type with G patch domain-containing protein [Trichoplax sp. H2]
MDEEKLKQDLENFKQQLNQVELLIASGSEDEDISKLKDDLKQLIELTEGSLLSLKKSKLISYIDQVIDVQTTSSSTSNDNKTTTLQQRRHINEKYTVGAKCRAPYQHSWGGIQYGNAVIVDTDSLDESDIVKVMFLNPISHEMRPCPFYLDGQCNYSDEDCKYSHGYPVNISDMKSFEEPNFSIIKERGSCLAKYKDDLWYRATIRGILDDGKISIHYDQYSIDSIVKIEDILPIEDIEDSNSSLEDEDISDYDIHSDDSADNESKITGVISLSVNPSEKYKLGEWENHTKVLNLREFSHTFLFAPQQSLIIKRASLDTCKELRETDRLKNPFKTKTKKKITELKSQRESRDKTSKAANDDDSTAFDIFDFINDRLSNVSGANVAEHRNDVKRSRKSEKDQNPKNLNIELVKVQQEIKNLKKIRSSQNTSLGRHTGKDKRMEDRITNKLRATSASLSRLEEKERSLQYRLKINTEKKKMTIF